MTRLFFSALALNVLLSILFGLAGCGAPAANGPTTGANTSTPAASPPAGTVDCSTASSGNILTAVYGAIEQSKSFTRQEWQYNISISTVGTRKTLKITGWSGERDDIAKKVRDTAIGCTVDDNYFKVIRDDLPSNMRVTAECANGTFACGDVCLPNGETCKLTGASAEIAGTGTNSNANSNSNATTNSNSNKGN